MGCEPHLLSPHSIDYAPPPSPQVRVTNRPEDYIPDPRRWWANGNIICNEEQPNFWGDNYLPQLRHMLQTLCEERAMPDCEFFINKRDFPHLKVRRVVVWLVPRLHATTTISATPHSTTKPSAERPDRAV